MEYKVLEDFPKYEISKSGHIRNIKTLKDKFCYKHVTGYYVVAFKVGGCKHERKVHRLVAETWLQPPTQELLIRCRAEWPYKPCVNHIDHDKTNNHVTNLEWCTVSENNKAYWKNGDTKGRNLGTNNPRSNLTEELVHSLCKFYEEGGMPKEAQTIFGISRSQATKIRSGFQWEHISSQYNIKVNKRSKKS